jgi:hypothetical protein
VWLEIVGRVIAKTPPMEEQPSTAASEESRLIIP